MCNVVALCRIEEEKFRWCDRRGAVLNERDFFVPQQAWLLISLCSKYDMLINNVKYACTCSSLHTGSRQIS